MSPLNGSLTDTEVMRLGALSNECPVESAGEVIGRLFDLLRDAQRKLAAYEDKPCGCRKEGE